MTQETRKLHTCVRETAGYLVCRCGAWNNVGSAYHDKTYGERCYMCRRALYADVPETDFESVTYSPDMANVRAAIERANRLLKKLYVDSTRLERAAYVTCLGHAPGPRANGCGAKLAVRNLVYIQTHWYTAPHGCTEGDYWNQGEGQFVCPLCGKLNRLGERHDVASLKPYFAKIEETHDR